MAQYTSPLAYTGVAAQNPPTIVRSRRRPTSNDFLNFALGTIWVIPTSSTVGAPSDEAWMLVNITANTGTWIQMDDAASSAQQFNTDSGNAVPAANILNVLGSHGLNTTGTGNTVTVLINNAITLGDLTPIAAGSNAISLTTGDIALTTGSIKFPTNTATAGVVFVNSNRFMHSYGTNNTFLGSNSGNFTFTGSNNIGIGVSAGSSLATTDSNNIDIGNTGTATDSGRIRIGTNATHTSCFITGIDGVNVGNVSKVVTMASNQLGTATITAGSGITVTPTANTITIAASGSSSGVVVTQYTSGSGTHTLNANTKFVNVALIGGGGGGCSGQCGTSTNASGGSGGAAGSSVVHHAPVSFFGGGGAGVSYAVGTGGAGGAGVNGTGINGNPGTNGVDTTFGYLTAYGGPGGGVTASTTTGGFSSWNTDGTSFASSKGGDANTPVGMVGQAGDDRGALFNATGGGAGGWYTVANTGVGGVGGRLVYKGSTTTVFMAGGTGGTANGGAGTAGNDQGDVGFSAGTGGGGGGGGGSVTPTGGAGGAGGYPGGGGGGGGAALNLNNSGAGGAGAAGYILVIEYLG